MSYHLMQSKKRRSYPEEGFGPTCSTGRLFPQSREGCQQLGKAMNSKSPMGSEFRKHLHAALDDIIDKRAIWATIQLAEEIEKASEAEVGNGETSEIAHQIWQASLRLAADLTSGVRQQLAPTFDQDDRIGMRHALSEIISLLSPIIPAKPNGLSPISEKCHSADDLLTYIGMLDYGETPAVFTREKSNRSLSAWQLDRYKFLQAIWAIHLDCKGTPKPTANVASHFSSDLADVNTVARLKKKLEAAANEGVGIWSLTPAHVSDAVTLAKNASTVSQPASERLVAAMFWNLAFGRRNGTVASIEEAGNRYRIFRSEIDDRQRNARRRGARSKKRRS
jgi:hypothetical protein